MIEEDLAAIRADLGKVLARLERLEGAVAAVTPPQYGTVDEAARILGVSTQTVRARIADKRITATKVGRSVRVDLRTLAGASSEQIAELARAARAPRASASGAGGRE